MGELNFDVPVLEAGKAFETFLAAAGAIFGSAPLKDLYLTTNLLPQVRPFDVGLNTPAANLRDVPEAKKVLLDLHKRSAYLKVNSILSIFDMGGTRVSFNYEVHKDWLSSSVKLLTPPNIPQATLVFDQNVTAWADSLASTYPLTTRATLVSESIPAAEREKLHAQQQAVNDLTAALARLQSAAIAQVEKQATYLSEKTEELDRQQQARDEVRQREHESRLADLVEDRERLAKEKAEIDARRATFARRALLTDLKTVVNKEFAITPRTNGVRNINHMLGGLGLLSGSTLAILGAAHLLHSEKFDWHQWSVFVAGSVLFSTTLIYYLRWNQSWFRQLAEAEFANRKLSIDVLRSSWVAEMALEWEEEKEGKEFPKELLLAFTAELFRTTTATDVEYHPIGQLANTLAGMTSLKVTDKGIEMERKEK